MANSLQFCSFYLDHLLLGVEIQSVQEVIRHLPMTRVPLASNVVSGLINLRGQIVTAVDLRRCLGMPDRATGQLPMNVVVRTADGPVSLLVDDIGDVIEVTDESYEPAPQNMSRQQKEMVQGVYKLDGRLLLVLNTERSLATGLEVA
ncbi:MAG: chemotaxis protein CheW [Terriglobales bacterium]|jgi:purine-binding chemotaxis protein CheW